LPFAEYELRLDNDMISSVKRPEGGELRMLKTILGRAVGLGVTPQLLLARVAVLRALNQLTKPRTDVAKSVERIFFSFPYHSVGDLTLSLTLLDRIHDRWPQARIDVAVGASMGPLVEAIPYVSRTFRLKRSTIRHPRFAAYAEIGNATRLFQSEIASTAYDLAIAPRWDSFDSFFSGYLAYLTGAPVRCGYSGRSDGGAPQVDRFYTVAAIGGAGEHESLRYTRLLGRCGLEPIDAVDENTPRRPIRALQQIAERRKVAGTAMLSPVPTPYAVLSPGSTKRRHIWPIERFASIGRQLNEEFGMRTIIIGSQNDAALCAELGAKIGLASHSMAGKTDALQMLDLIAGAALFLGNESGPAHIAGGLGIRTIVVCPHTPSSYVDHQNSPWRWRPAGNEVRMLQPAYSTAPCTGICQNPQAHCILRIKEDQVLASIRSALHVEHPSFA
jgi:ADP-heptose:LPS heptosyltransferase